MRRILPAAVIAGLIAATAAHAQSQLGGAQDNSTIAVPPAPAIVAAPPAVLTPPNIVSPPPPPGLVPVSPPASDDSGNGGNTDNGSADNGDTGALPAQNVAPETAPPGLTDSGAAANTDNGTGDDNGTEAPGTPAASGDAQNQPAPQDTIPTPPNTWQPAKFAQIGVLDKVGGGVSQVSIPVGGQSVVGDLQISVVACLIRPPDQVPDAAAFLALQNTANLSAPPDYRGWVIRSEPGAAVAGDASETLRVIDCSQS